MNEKELKKLFEDVYVFVDDDMGGHFDPVLGNQIANTKFIYFKIKNTIENLQRANEMFRQKYNRQVLDNEKIVKFYENDDIHNELYKLRSENAILKRALSEIYNSDRLEEIDE